MEIEMTEEMKIIRSELIASVFLTLKDHCGGSFKEIMKDEKYVVLFNMVCYGIDQGLREAWNLDE